MPMNGMAIMTRHTMTMMTTVVPSPSGGFDPYEVFIPLCYSLCSGNRPGIQRAASFAGKARRNGARELSETSTSRPKRAEVTRLAWRSLVPMIWATSPLGSSPR